MDHPPRHSPPEPSRDEPEPIKRLSVNLPERLHTRFKTACSATNRRMGSEIVDLVRARTAELEEQAGLWLGMPDRGPRRMQATEEPPSRNHPAGDVDETIADARRRRGLG